MSRDRICQFLFSLILTTLLITACDRHPALIQLPPTSASDCRIAQHYAGQSCIPNNPQRVVTLDGTSFEYALSLGIVPIGSVLDQLDLDLGDRTANVENIGTSGEPNLEKVLTLQPDLILGLDFHQTIYAQAEKIAPTVLFEFQHSGQWKEIFMNFGETLGKGDVAREAIDRYYQRLDEFKAKLRGASPQVSVVRVSPISLYLYFKDSFCGVVLQDAGLSRPPAQNISAAEGERLFNNPIQAPISKELLDRADGDVMFVWTGENTAEAEQGAQSYLNQLKSNPLWQKLSAVQKNQVYQVPSYWIGSSPIAANAVIDDLFKYLIQPSS